MRRKQNIQDTFKSVVPEFTAGPWSVGYSGHTDISAQLISGNVEILNIRNITDQVIPGTSTVVTNDVYVDYSYLAVTGTTSIYNYVAATTTTTTTAAATTTTTTTVATTTTTTTAAATTTTTTTT